MDDRRYRRRKAAASRRAARENGGGFSSGDDDRGSSYAHAHGQGRTQDRPKQPHGQPLETSLLSSLSQALTNIDLHNNSYFSRKNSIESGRGGSEGGSNGHDDSVTITFSSPNNKNNSNRHNIHNTPERRYTKLPSPPTQFSSYLKFNRPSLNCMLIFTVCYLLVLICCYPMIYYSNVEVLPTDDDFVKGKKHHIKRGSSFQHIRGHDKFINAKHAVTDKLGTLKQRAIEWEEEAKLKAQRGAVEIQETEKEIIDSIATGTVGRRGGEDAKRASSLLDEAVKVFEGKRLQLEKEEDDKHVAVAANNAGVHDHWNDAVAAWDKAFVPDKSFGSNVAATNVLHSEKTPGFMVLGMHRSGTSMLSGLLVKGFGYETGGPLIGASVSCQYLLPVVQNQDFSHQYFFDYVIV